jgi:hypothetical protein
MVEADTHLKLLPTFIYNIYIVCLTTLICCPWAYRSRLTYDTVIPTLLGSDLRIPGSLV